MIRLAILQDSADRIAAELKRQAPREAGAFCLLRSGRGGTGVRLVAGEVLLPGPGAWETQGEGTLRPTAQCISAAISRAVSAHAGLLFIHSHPDPAFPLGLSRVDRSAFLDLARVLAPTLDGPFAAGIIHPKGWAGVVWEEGAGLKPIDRIVSVGRTLRFLSPLPPVEDTSLDARQRDALGIMHDRLRALTVGVVGCGGLGSPTAEQLTRMGISEVLLVDHDVLDTPSNVRRVFGSTAADLRATVPPPKVDVVGRHLDGLCLGAPARRMNNDVRKEEAVRALLDTDIVLSGTDNHGSRAILNYLPSSYLLPVIDVGTRVGAKPNGLLTGLTAEVRILTPTTPCFWCRNTIDGDVIRAENLPESERFEQAREGYLLGRVGEPAPSVVALTVFGSGLATCAMLSLLAEEADVAPHGYWVDGFMGDAQETKPVEPKAGCCCRRNMGHADSAAPSFVD